jgi:hypothetical protein
MRGRNPGFRPRTPALGSRQDFQGSAKFEHSCHSLAKEQALDGADEGLNKSYQLANRPDIERRR